MHACIAEKADALLRSNNDEHCVSSSPVTDIAVKYIRNTDYIELIIIIINVMGLFTVNSY